MTEAEIEGEYEAETGNVIIETIAARTDDALHMPAVLVRSHGPFTWGTDADQAVVNAIAVEAVAAMAERTLSLDPEAPDIGEALLRRHFDRKHGPGAYYGQPGDDH
jgi:L-ribulose-5-phosphate 4-epimerase